MLIGEKKYLFQPTSFWNMRQISVHICLPTPYLPISHSILFTEWVNDSCFQSFWIVRTFQEPQWFTYKKKPKGLPVLALCFRGPEARSCQFAYAKRRQNWVVGPVVCSGVCCTPPCSFPAHRHGFSICPSLPDCCFLSWGLFARFLLLPTSLEWDVCFSPVCCFQSLLIASQMP